MRILLAALVLLCAARNSQQQFPTDCYPDVTFIVETSERIGTDLITQFLTTVRDTILPQLSIGAEQTHVALVHFSSPTGGRTGVSFPLTQYTTLAGAQGGFTNLISTVNNVLGVSDIRSGLNLATEQVFVPPADRSPNRPNVVILIAEGFWDNAGNCCLDPMSAATNLRNKVPLLYAVDMSSVTQPLPCTAGTLQHTCTQNLIEIIGGNSQRVVTLPNIASILTMLTTDIVQYCVQPTTTTTTPTTTTLPPPTCKCMDLVILIDTSESVRSDGFFASRKAARDMVQQFPIGQSGVRVALLTYSNTTFGNYDLKAFDSLAAFNAAIDLLTYQPDITNLANPLTKAETWLSTEGRSGVNKVVWLFSDGRPTMNTPDPVPIATRIRSSPISAQIISIGIPGLNGALQPPDTVELGKISGNTADVIAVNSITELPSREPEILARTNCSPNPCASCTGDIVFIIETSERLNDGTTIPAMFDRMLSMLQQIGNLGDDKNRVALVTFSSPDARTKTHFDFTTTNDITSVTNAVNTIRANLLSILGISDIDGGIKQVINNVFTTAHGDRTGSPNYIVYLAEGYYDDALPYCCNSPFTDAQTILNLSDGKDSAYSVAEGPELAQDVRNLQRICGNAMHVFNDQNYQLISTDIKNKIQNGCQPPSTKCLCMDLAIIIDGSQSTTAANFEKLKTEAIALAEKMSVGQSAVRIAYVVFSAAPHAAEDYRRFTSFDEFKTSLQTVNYSPDYTNTDSAFQRINDWRNNLEWRTGVPNVIYFFSSGKHSPNTADPTIIAQTLRGFGSQIISIAVPDQTGVIDPTNIPELTSISGCSSSTSCTNLFQVTNIDQLSTYTDKILAVTTCSHTACT